jgi:hypothetical protein
MKYIAAWSVPVFVAVTVIVADPPGLAVLGAIDSPTVNAGASAGAGAANTSAVAIANSAVRVTSDPMCLTFNACLRRFPLV